MKRALQMGWVALIAISPLSAQEPKLQTILGGHSDDVYSVAWSRDGSIIASGCEDRTIRLWSVAEGKVVTTFKAEEIDYKYPADVKCVAWSPDGKTLASASYDETVRLWDVAGRKNIATLQGHPVWVCSVAWSPDGKALASVDDDGAVKLWDVGTGENTATIERDTDLFQSLAWSPDGKTLALGNARGVVKLWNVASGKRLVSLRRERGANALAIAYSPNGKTLASVNGCTIELWDIPSRTHIGTLKGHSSDLITYGHGNYGGQHIPAVKSVAFSPDGRTLASGSQDKTVILWNVADRKSIVTLKGHAEVVNSVAWSPNGKTLASASDDKTIRLWDVAALRATKAAERSSDTEKAPSK